ncbi:hypothetical protein, partial [Phenylobacterium sp.]|uniref:hypothetical protein n=1 Tax=Phenylobacterium sp. TaxID=1871053 RepID=UPI0025F2B743
DSDVDARDWIAMKGSYDLAVGYSLIFWPTFHLVGGCVRTGAWTPEDTAKARPVPQAERRDVEALHNHMVDLHCNDETLTEAQARYLGRTLKAIYEVKLKADFPDRSFTVYFPDEPDLDIDAYQLTFWQA